MIHDLLYYGDVRQGDYGVVATRDEMRNEHLICLSSVENTENDIVKEKMTARTRSR